MTQVIHGDDGIEDTHDVAPPLHLTSTFAASTAAEFAEMATRSRHPEYYTRYGNPTSDRAAAIVAGLEGAEAGLVGSTGMGVIATTMLALLSQGDHVVAQKNHYMGTTKLLEELLPRYGVSTTFVDQTDLDAFRSAVTPATRVIVAETPANPTLQLTDLVGLSSLAREQGITTVVDNTVASPINQRPIELGCDLVVHAGTKYLGGHHDLLAGVVVGTSDLIDRIWNTSIVTGASGSPFDAWLMLRGLRTLPLRVAHHNRSAQAVAEFLEGHPGVEAVHYPGLSSHPQRSLAVSQMEHAGGLLSFEVAGGYEAAQIFMEGLTLIQQAVSLGGFESLAVHAAAMWEGTLGEQGALDAGVQPNLIRLSVGLEDPGDVIEDLAAALDTV